MVQFLLAKRSLYGTLLNTFRSVFSVINVNASKMLALISLKMSFQFSFKNLLVLSPSSLSPPYKFPKSKIILKKKKDKLLCALYLSALISILYSLPLHFECELRFLNGKIVIVIPLYRFSAECYRNFWVNWKGKISRYTHSKFSIWIFSGNKRNLLKVVLLIPSPWIGSTRTRPEILYGPIK